MSRSGVWGRGGSPFSGRHFHLLFLSLQPCIVKVKYYFFEKISEEVQGAR